MTTPPEVENWLLRAESNLHIARQGKRAGVFLEDLCFEAQQAAEKALKALLIHHGGTYPKTHSFALLLERLEKFVPIPTAVKEVTELTDYAVQTRYPGDYYPVSKEEYERALDLAAMVLAWVEGHLKDPVGRGRRHDGDGDRTE